MTGERLVVVGVDGSEGGRRALAWALAHAGKTGATVEVVSVFAGGDEPLEWPSDAVASERHRTEAFQNDEVASALAECAVQPPVARTVVEGRPVPALSAAARDADMLVLGSHGHGRLRTALLGSVTEGCIRAGTCSVLVGPSSNVASDHGEAATGEVSVRPAAVSGTAHLKV